MYIVFKTSIMLNPHQILSSPVCRHRSDYDLPSTSQGYISILILANVKTEYFPFKLLKNLCIYVEYKFTHWQLKCAIFVFEFNI